MSVLDGLLGQLASNVDIGNLAAKVGLSPEQVEQAVHALGVAHPQPEDTVGLAAAQTGLPADILQQIVGHIGGEGALGRFASMLQDQGGANLGEAVGDALGGALGGLFGQR
jgi:hypothetical protein